MNFPATGIVASDGDYLRLRALPGAASDVIGHLRNGAAVTLIARQPDAQGRAWYQVELGAVVPDLFADEALTRPVRLTMTGWCAGWLIRVGAEEERPQPTPGDGPAGGEVPGEAPGEVPGEAPQPEGALPDIGINWLNGGPGATKAMAKGCPALQPSFNPGQARDLKKKYPDRHIVVRGWIEGGPPSISQWKQRTELDTLLPGTIVLGVNENDNGFHDGDPGTILDRARFDAAAWQECQARGLIYAGGGFAVGTPNIIDPAIAQAMRDGYAPLFNAGMWFNQHCYMARDGSGQNGQPGVPLRDRFSTAYPFTLHGRTFPIRQSWWTAERWRFYCAVCGFDPRRSAFISDEMGLEGAPEMVDAPTPGGFAANPQVDVIGYLKDFQHYSGLPAWFGEDGNAHPSPFKFGLVFCANGGERWAAYEVSGHVDAMAEALWSAARAPVAHAGVKRAAKKPKTKTTKTKTTKAKATKR